MNSIVFRREERKEKWEKVHFCLQVGSKWRKVTQRGRVPLTEDS